MMSYLRGRMARPASAGWNLLKTYAQSVVFWSLFLGVIPAGLYAAEGAVGLGSWRFGGPISLWAGVILFALGGTLGLTSCTVMALCGRGTPLPADCPRQLVIAGPYRHIRNPMAVAGLSQGLAVGLALGSPAVIAYALVGGPLWNILVRPWEEYDLEMRFGDAYRRYRAAVRCWWPCLRGYNLPASVGSPSLNAGVGTLSSSEVPN
ncbi:MAG: isoprenylcysteine carboxylmethyltransferase family protein [Fimbriiglobus sp.]|jgi:protein-S-isoprenylcysteine O-methyltransferase Ste14|nr:isoprenylcysteine carboxylmethyltransferase family protein [Fimbriiglobus sp.]